MATVPIHNAGAIGIIKDLPGHDLLPEAWSDGQNVRFRDGKIIRSLGHSAVFGTPSIAPQWAMNVQTPADVFWMYANASAVYATDGSTHADISKVGGYTMNSDDLWSGGVLGGVPVITSGADTPQYWNNPSLAVKLADLPNWPASTLCRDIKPFGAFLVALDITKAGVRFPHRVKWSHPADPGSVPSTWDETDDTKDAGEKDLTDVGSGFNIEGHSLRDIFVIYKENSTWGMQFIGGFNIFRFFPIFITSGILSKHCATPFFDGKRELHFVATGNDVIVHDARTATSVLDKRWRKFINDNINTSSFNRSFVVADHTNNEAWFCFPSGSNTWPNLAIVWNWKDNTIGHQELPADISFIASGVVVSGATPGVWDSDAGTWDTDTTQWDQRPFDALTLSLLLVDPTNTKLYLGEDTNAFNGTGFSSYVERTGHALVGQDRNGNPKSNLSVRKLITRIWPKGAKGAFNVRIGAQEEIDGPIIWSPSKSFTPGTDKYLDFSIGGRLTAIRIEDGAVKAQWEVSGYDLEVVPLGAL